MFQLILTFFAAFQQTNVYNLALKQNNQQLLQERLLDISNPFSVNYGKYWDKDIINMLVEPKGKDELLDRLNNYSITIEKDYGDGLLISTTEENIENVFNINYHFVENNNVEITYSIPEELSLIEFIEGIPSYKEYLKHKEYVKNNKESLYVNDIDNGYVGTEVFNWLYNVSDDKGCLCLNTSVASIEYGGGNGFNQDDLVSNQQLNNISINRVRHSINNGMGSDVESQLDIQMMGLIGGENMDIWYWNEDNWLYSLAVNIMNNASVPNILSMSYGWAEDQQCQITTCGNLTSEDYVNRVNMEYVKLGLRGITIVVASGDAGSPGRTSEQCDPNRPINAVFPGSSPWVVSVGATYIVNSTNSSNKTSPIWNSTLCNEYGCPEHKEQDIITYDKVGWTSGGGISKISKRQSMFDKANNGYINSRVSMPWNYPKDGRMYPDVSLIGHYCPVMNDNSLIGVDGTSCSTPFFATVLALLNRHQLIHGKPKLGWVNPILYLMAENDSNVFIDLEEGYTWCTEQTCCPLNERNGSDFGFKATKGYDPVYGLGLPNVGRMKEWLSRWT